MTSDDLVGGDWLEANRRNWDERVPVHLQSDFYDQSALRAGAGQLYPLEEAELAALFPGGWAGKRVLHLQCHFGADTLVLAQRGAEVVGLDFSHEAIVAARKLAAEVGLDSRARFIEGNIYDARHLLPQPGSFDVVFTTWGTIGWLPDVEEWARIVSWFLKPGGCLYFVDGHPTAWVFTAATGAGSEAMPVMFYPYDTAGVADVEDDPHDYADKSVVLANARTHSWMHPLGSTVSALLAAGLHLESLTEHYEVPFRMYPVLEPTPDRMYRWPRERWLPLAVSIVARSPLSS